MKVEMSTDFKEKISFKLLEDHPINDGKVIPKGTEVLQIRPGKKNLSVITDKFMNGTPMLIHSASEDTAIFPLEDFLASESAREAIKQVCPAGIDAYDDEVFKIRLQRLKKWQVKDPENKELKTCTGCTENCIVNEGLKVAP